MESSERSVAKGVRDRLDLWVIRKVVSRWERVNAGKVKLAYGGYMQLAKAGFPDYMAFILIDKVLHICFFETKKPVGGMITYPQMTFAKLYGECRNTSWDLITDPNQVDKRIEKLTGYTQKALDGIKF